jgi:hypothetical protein
MGRPVSTNSVQSEQAGTFLDWDPKRQRTAALQNPRAHDAHATALAFWSAAVLCRFGFFVSIPPDNLNRTPQFPARDKRVAVC